MVLGTLPVPGRLSNLEKVRQEHTVLTVGVVKGCLGIFSLSRLSFLSSISLSLGDGPI